MQSWGWDSSAQPKAESSILSCWESWSRGTAWAEGSLHTALAASWLGPGPLPASLLSVGWGQAGGAGCVLEAE